MECQSRLDEGEELQERSGADAGDRERTVRHHPVTATVTVTVTMEPKARTAALRDAAPEDALRREELSVQHQPKPVLHRATVLQPEAARHRSELHRASELCDDGWALPARR
jgi:hypothetical protein